MIALTMVATSTAKLASDSLHLAYTNKSQLWIFSLCDQLTQLSKDSCLVADYLHQVHSICNMLTIASATIANSGIDI